MKSMLEWLSISFKSKEGLHVPSLARAFSGRQAKMKKIVILKHYHILLSDK